MTITEFFYQYWPILCVVLGAALLAIVVLRRSRGQRVTLTERDGSTRTLERPVVAPTTAPAPLLVDSELTRLKGVGPKFAAVLAGEGFGSLTGLAALNEAQQTELDTKLGTFSGRVGRDRLVEQARLLSTDPAAYETAFGKGA